MFIYEFQEVVAMQRGVVIEHDADVAFCRLKQHLIGLSGCWQYKQQTGYNTFDFHKLSIIHFKFQFVVPVPSKEAYQENDASEGQFYGHCQPYTHQAVIL